MIDGLKLAMSGEKLISLLDARIDRIHEIIRIKRDAIAGLGPPSRREYISQVPAEVVEEEILQHEHRIRVVTIVRDHILRGETYLIGERDLAFGELLPDPPVMPETEFDVENLRWVEHPVDVRTAARPCCPGG
jgi:hypothetical protein